MGAKSLLAQNNGFDVMNPCYTALLNKSSASSGFNNFTNGIVLWWKFDETTGSTMSDSSGNGNTGTIGNYSTDAVHGTNGGIISNFFVGDGISLSVSAASTNVANGVTSQTITCWLKYNTNFASTFSTIIASKDDVFVGNDIGWTLQFGSQHAGVHATNISFGVYNNDGSTYYEGPFSSTLTTNTWHFVAGVITNYGGNTGNGNGGGISTFLYVDGNLVTGSPASLGGAVNNIATSTKIIAGSGGTDTSFFLGPIDDFRVYTNILTPAQITQLYNWGLTFHGNY